MRERKSEQTICFSGKEKKRADVKRVAVSSSPVCNNINISFPESADNGANHSRNKDDARDDIHGKLFVLFIYSGSSPESFRKLKGIRVTHFAFASTKVADSFDETPV